MPFRDLSGQRLIVGLLARSIAREALPPSLLFAGPDGVGKRTTALAVAQALNCLTPGGRGGFDADACGECTACRRIERGIHPDVRTIEPGDSGSIRIESIRDVIEAATYRPFEGRRRVVVIDDADALMVAAQNALLKTLEEPRPASVFILVTPHPDLLLPTVRSRCSQLRFGRLNVADVVGVLTRRCGYTEAEARAAAPVADGSIRRALDARESDLESARAAAEQLLVRTAGAADMRKRLEAAKDLVAAPRSGASPAADRDALTVQLRALSSLLRDVAILTSRATACALANADLKPQLERLAAAFGSGRAMRAFTAVDQALGALERNASPKVVADWLAVQI